MVEAVVDAHAHVYADDVVDGDAVRVTSGVSVVARVREPMSLDWYREGSSEGSEQQRYIVDGIGSLIWFVMIV